MKRLKFILLLLVGSMLLFTFFPETSMAGPKEAGAEETSLIDRIKEIETVLEKNKENLEVKREEYNKAKNKLKKAARTGFLGFGRTKEETNTLIEAKREMARIKKEYKEIRLEISRLQTKLREAERERALKERRN